jgi:putative transposase
MSRYRRSLAQGASFFFTVNAYRRRPVLTHPDVRAALRMAISDVRQALPFRIDAWALLPDHLHAIWTLPESDAVYGKRWGLIKAQVSRLCAHVVTDNIERSASRVRRREAGLWQRRFWEHQIRDEGDFERHVDYIHYNPVKHGLVTHAGDLPYTTFHRYVKRGILATDWAVDPGEVIGDAGE